jgi:hypothetical protein
MRPHLRSGTTTKACHAGDSRWLLRARLICHDGLPRSPPCRDEGCCYVDKSALAIDLIESGSYFFLSRPPQLIGQHLSHRVELLDLDRIC